MGTKLPVRPPVLAAAAFVGLLPFIVWSCAKTLNDTMDDLTVTARVKTSLLNDREIDATTIDVETAQGVVTLSGTVKSSTEEARAIDLTRRTPGVKDVKSSLQVAGAQLESVSSIGRRESVYAVHRAQPAAQGYRPPVQAVRR
jgi:BON domain-containing protein